MTWRIVRHGFAICYRGRICGGGRLIEVTEDEAAGLVHATESASPGWLRRVAHRATWNAAARIEVWREERRRRRRRRAAEARRAKSR